MRTNRPLVALLAAVTLASIPLLAVVGNREGNGGDHVRGTFIRMGLAIIEYLENRQEGVQLVARHSLDVTRLRDTLTTYRIRVVEGELRDNRGTLVDATGEGGIVTLKKSAWLEHFERERDVYYLVFHEMLRSAGYPDTDYPISLPLRPFPRASMIATRITPLLPLIGDELLSNFIDPERTIYNGTGCASQRKNTFIDFDPERNIIDISFSDYASTAVPIHPHVLTRKNCSLAIPFRGFSNRKLVVTQIDLSGTVTLPRGGSGTINLETFLAGSRGPAHRKNLDAQHKPQVGRVQMRINDTFSTPCGQSQILRLATSATVDPVESKRGMVKISRISLYLKIENCSH